MRKNGKVAINKGTCFSFKVKEATCKIIKVSVFRIKIKQLWANGATYRLFAWLIVPIIIMLQMRKKQFFLVQNFKLENISKIGKNRDPQKGGESWGDLISNEGEAHAQLFQCMSTLSKKNYT